MSWTYRVFVGVNSVDLEIMYDKQVISTVEAPEIAQFLHSLVLQYMNSSCMRYTRSEALHNATTLPIHIIDSTPVDLSWLPRSGSSKKEMFWTAEQITCLSHAFADAPVCTDIFGTWTPSHGAWTCNQRSTVFSRR